LTSAAFALWWWRAEAAATFLSFVHWRQTNGGDSGRRCWLRLPAVWRHYVPLRTIADATLLHLYLAAYLLHRSILAPPPAAAQRTLLCYTWQTLFDYLVAG